MVSPERPPGSVAPDDDRGRGNARGQAFTLEAVVASLLLVGTVAVVMGSTAVTPGVGSGDDATDQRRALAAGALDAAAANGSLDRAVRYWDPSTRGFYGAPIGGVYRSGGPPNRFGRLLNRSLRERGLAYDVTVRYVAANGSVVRQPMVDMGEPVPGAVHATERVTLSDDDVLVAANGSPTTTTLGSSTFYAPDVADGPTYTVVRVEVVAWPT